MFVVLRSCEYKIMADVAQSFAGAAAVARPAQQQQGVKYVCGGEFAPPDAAATALLFRATKGSPVVVRLSSLQTAAARIC